VVLPFVSRLAGQPTSLGPAVAGTSFRPLRPLARYTTSSDVTDEYEEGKGSLQEPGFGMDPNDRGVFIRSNADDPDSEIYYHFGFELDIPLKAAATATIELAELLETVEAEKKGS
jgi:hypothetical protein